MRRELRGVYAADAGALIEFIAVKYKCKRSISLPCCLRR